MNSTNYGAVNYNTTDYNAMGYSTINHSTVNHSTVNHSSSGYSSSSYGAHLSIHNLGKSFGNFQVLQGIDLEIAPGEFVAVVGKSGCGKSTLLRLLSGLDVPTEGQVYIDGQPLHGLNPSARVMSQDSRLLPWRRVLENVTLGLQHQGRQRGQWALQQVGLGERDKHWITQLSGGQRQRVALARALVSQPRLLLLDEPLGALDALTRLGMQQLIETLWLEQQFTAFLVTHEVEEAVSLADRVIVIEEGRISLNLPVTLPRPRNQGQPEFMQLKLRILNQILGRQRHANREATVLSVLEV